MTNSIIIDTEGQRTRALGIINGLDLSRIMVLTIEKFVKKRSLPQNKLYWKWIDILGPHFGYEPEEMAEELKAKFLPAAGRIMKLDLDGNEREFLTTKNLKKIEFKEYLDAIDRFAASHGVILPHPEDVQRRY